MDEREVHEIAGGSSRPSESVASELKQWLDQKSGRVGDVYRRPGLSADQIAAELGVSTPGFVSNNRIIIDALLTGKLPSGPAISNQVAGTVRSARKDARLSVETHDYLDRLLKRLVAAAPLSFAAPVPTDEVQHAWKVHGSGVLGQDMVPTWRIKGTVSLAAKLLRSVEPDTPFEELQGFVEEDYRSSGYAARQEKVDEFYTFLGRMHTGDLIITASQGQVSFGVVAGDAEYVKSSDGRSNLRRPVKWESTTIPVTNLPLELASKLGTQTEVVDLTAEVDTIRELMAHQAPLTPAKGLNIPDATHELADRVNVSRDWLQECVDLLRDRPQLIFYGPPGTGKTYIAQKLAQHVAGQSNVTIVQFHPAYSYEDFFEGFRPAIQTNGQVGFELRPGPLRKLVDKAMDNPDTPYVLIVDEINRGNLAKIFGELYFLLEYRDQSIDVLYKSEKDNAKPFMLPRNVIMLGTMNTADRSIALVDAAMRRRFAFLPLHPSEPPTDGILRTWLKRTKRPPETADLLDELNRRIDDADFKIGPSYFMRDAVYAPNGLERVWKTAILPLLEEFHYGDRSIDITSTYGLDSIRGALQTQRHDTKGQAALMNEDDDDSPANPA